MEWYPGVCPGLESGQENRWKMGLVWDATWEYLTLFFHIYTCWTICIINAKKNLNELGLKDYNHSGKCVKRNRRQGSTYLDESTKKNVILLQDHLVKVI